MTYLRRVAAVGAVGAGLLLWGLLAMPGHAEEKPGGNTQGTICYEVINVGDVPCGGRIPLRSPAPTPMNATVSTVAGSATSPEDYRGFKGVKVVVPPGSTQVEVPLSIRRDDVTEPDEEFYVVVETGNDVNRTVVTIKDGEAPRQ